MVSDDTSQGEDNDSVRISIDKNLMMWREHADPYDTTVPSWFTPTAVFGESDVHRFPFLVLETKLHSGKVRMSGAV